VIILPLWFLVLVSIVSGHVLARMEFPGEVTSNDSQLASRASLVFQLENTIRIVNELPRFCYDAYRDRVNANLVSLDNTTLKDIWDFFQEDLAEFMNNCTEITQEIIDPVLTELNAQLLDYQTSELTFDWIRCINETAIEGRRSWLHPTDLERDAVKLINQTVYFSTIWEQQQEFYFYEYLGDNLDPTPEEQTKAFAYSIDLATGDEECDPNSQGTAWFWFTVMTTVGK
jgi:hypothetical protein